jgi:hypothetical protein
MINKREYEDLDSILIKKLKNIDANQNISFEVYGDTTYIKKVADCYLVSTVNNIDWDLYDCTTRLTDNAREELKTLLSTYSHDNTDYGMIERILEEDYEEFYEFGNDYYNLETEVIGVETWDSCPKCNNHMWNVQKFGKICLKCNPILKRKEKLEKINNIAKKEDNGIL